jgi:hypothetical protein
VFVKRSSRTNKSLHRSLYDGPFSRDPARGELYRRISVYSAPVYPGGLGVAVNNSKPIFLESPFFLSSILPRNDSKIRQLYPDCRVGFAVTITGNNA